MLPEIGSNFWQYDLSKPRTEKLWWENSDYHIHWLKSGRNAMRAISNLLADQRPLKEIVVPAYLCETEIDPWRENCWKISFYQINRNYEIDFESLSRILKSKEPCVLLVQSYYGFDTITPDIAALLREAKQHGWIIIEDLTHAIFTDYHLDFADYYTSSLRKFSAIPNGGIIVSKEDISSIRPKPEGNRTDETALLAFRTKSSYFLSMNPEEKVQFRSLYSDLADLIGIDDQIYQISPLSYQIFGSLDISFIHGRRIENFNYLAKHINQSSFFELPLKRCSDSDCPLYLPVYFHSSTVRDECRQYLSAHDIYCPIIWHKPLHHIIPYPVTESIYDHILCFPIDQRYSVDEMQRIVDVLAQWEEGNEA